MYDHRVFRNAQTLDRGIVAAAQAVIEWDRGRPQSYRRPWWQRWERECWCSLSITDALEIAELAVTRYLRHHDG